MSSIDQRVVQMGFDDQQFQTRVAHTLQKLDELKKSLNFSGLKTGLSELGEATKAVSLDAVSKGVEDLKDKFSNLGIVGVTALMRISNQALDTGKKVVSAFTIDPVKSGFQEYETQINATQTILANTQKEGATIEDVNAALDELNLYADKTIYNFTEMTRNIGTFTAAGVDLKTSVSAIKGIANLAAVSGSTSQQASTAMYQLSQALAAGTVKLMDWNSVVNAGMGGAVFQDALKETARVHGIAIDQMIKDEGSFRETLSSGWLTSEILTDTLEKFTGDLSEAQLLAKGYSVEQVKNIMAMGVTASDAATKVKTFTQLVDTLKEAAQSGWSGSWRLIIGDFEEAKELYTKISDALGGAIEKSNEARIKTLMEWKELGGRDSVIAAITNLVKGLGSAVKPVSDAFHKVFQTLSGADLYGITKKFEYFTRGLYLTERGQKNLSAAAEAVFRVIKLLAQGVGAAAVVFGKLLGFVSPVVTVLLYLAGAIGTVVNAFFSIFESIDNLKASLKSIQEFFSSLANIFNSAGSTLDGVIDVIFEVCYQALIKGFELIEEVTGGQFKEYTESILAGFIGVGNQIYAVIKLVQEAFNSGDWSKVLQPIKNLSPALSDLFDAIEVSYIEGGEGLAGVVEVLFDGLVGLVRIGFDNFQSVTGISVESVRDAWVSSIQELRNKVVDSLLNFRAALETFDWQAAGLQPVIDFLTKAKEAIVSLVGQLKGPVLEFLDTINPLKAFSDSVSKLTSGMETSFSGLAERLKQIFKGVSFGDVIKVVDTTIVAVLTGALFKFATSVKKVSKSLETTGLPTLLKTLSDGLKDTFDSVGDTLKTWQKEIKSDIIMKIAKAVAILAVALIALSFIPSDKLTGSLIAVGGLIGELTSALVALDKVVGMDDIAKLSGLSKLFIAISASVLILSFAVAKLANIDANKIDQGFTAVLGLVSMMTAVGYAMSRYNGDISKGSIAFVLLAASVNILAKAVDRFAKMNPAGLAQGLKAVIVLMAAMTAAINFMPKDTVVNKKVFVELALALTLLSFCVKIIGGMPTEQAVQGVIAVGALLGELTIASRLAKDVKVGNFIQMAAAVDLLIPAVAILGALKTETAVQGVIAVGALLSEFVLASMFAKQVNTAGFIMMALAIDILVPAVLILGVIPWQTALQGVIGVGILLAELVAATNLLPKDTVTKGLGIAAVALGLSILVGALTAIAIIPFPLIIIGLVEMAAALGILIAAAYLASPVSSVLIALGGAFALLGVGMLGVGAGITLAAAGLATLAGLGAAAGIAIFNLGVALVSVIKNAIIGFGEGLVALAKIVKNSAPILAEGVIALIDALLQSAASKWESFKETVGPMIDSLIDFIVTYGPKLIETGVGMFINLIAGLGERAGEIAQEGIKLVVNFIAGVRSKIEDLIQAGIDFAIDFINGVANGLRDNTQPLLDAIGNLGSAMVDGLGQALVQGIEWVVEKTKELGEAILKKIKEFFGIHSPSTVFNDIGVNLIEGLIEGIGSMISSALETVTSLGSKILGIFHKEDEHEDAGHENMDNLTSGYKDKETQAVNTAKTIQTQVIAALKSFNPKFTEAGRGNMISFSEGLPKPLRQILETLDSMISTSVARIKAFQSKFYDAGEYLVWGFIEGIEDNIRRAARAAAEMAKAALEAAKDELDIASPSKEFEKVGKYIVFGMEDGIRDNTDKATDATKNMASEQLQTMRDSLSDLSGLIDDELDTTPVITPVLDADEFKMDINDLDDWMHASMPAINGVRLEVPDDVAKDAGQVLTGGYRKPAEPTVSLNPETQPVYNFYQYNTSPKALSRLEIYRQTRNQFVRFKEVVKKGR